MDWVERGHRGIAIWMLDHAAHQREYIGLLPKDIWHMILCSFITLQVEGCGSLYVTRFFDLQHSFGNHASMCRVGYRDEIDIRMERRSWRLGWPDGRTSGAEFPTLDECRAAMRREI